MGKQPYLNQGALVLKKFSAGPTWVHTFCYNTTTHGQLWFMRTAEETTHRELHHTTHTYIHTHTHTYI
jgi:hypothetical protein